MASAVKKRILVAVDGSEQAMEAVRYVGKILPPGGFEVVLFHVMTKVPESFWDLEKEPVFQYRIANVSAWEKQQQQMIETFMENARKVLLDEGLPNDAVQVNIHARKAGIARDIISESHNGYSAVVVGRRGLSELKDLVLGSIADKLVGRLAHVPLWVVGGKPVNGGRLLLALDPSEGAMQAVEYVASMLDGSPRVEVTLFHAVRGLDVFLQGVGEAFSVNYDKNWIEKARKELDEAAKEIEPMFDEARERLVKAGLDAALIKQRVAKGISSRAGAIVDEAQQGGHDTIVVGRRGLSRIEEFFIGRVSSKVIQLARDKTVWVVS